MGLYLTPSVKTAFYHVNYKLTHARGWGSELRAREEEAESFPRQLSSYVGWNLSKHIEGDLVEDLYCVQVW